MRVVMLLAAGLLLGACAPGDDPGLRDPAPPDSELQLDVVIRDSSFGDEEIQIPVGTTVTWRNEDGFDHTVTHGEHGEADGAALFDELVAPGEELSHLFEVPGLYPITCRLHPEMNMLVIVE
jgi:plastocyanin